MANEIKIDGEYFKHCDDCDVYYNATYTGATCPCCEAKAKAIASEEARQELSDSLHSLETEIYYLTEGGV